MATEEREESLPQYVAPSFSLSVSHREPSWSGELYHPSTTPSPWSSRSPGSLPPPNVALRGVSFLSPYLPPVLPGAASRYSRIPVSPPPSPRCIADESIPADILTHWRSMPRSRERRRPQPPTFPTLQPPSRNQTRALGRVGRRLPRLTSLCRPRLYKRDDATRPRPARWQISSASLNLLLILSNG